MRDELLAVSNLSAGYGPVVVLHQVSLVVGAGEFVALVGPNGSGKTTLLRTIAGVLPPIEGTIRFAGAPVGHRPPEERVHLGISSVPEGRHLFAELTVLDHLDLGAHVPRARPFRHATLGLVRELFPQIWEKRHRRVAELSAGEQQMVAVARALMARPRLLLLDDPFLGLHGSVIAGFCAALRRIGEEGVAVLVAGQHVRRILSLADRAYLLVEGQVAQEGAGRALLAAPAIEALLL